MKYQFNDGGRSNYFHGAQAEDCVTRAIAIAADLNYKDVYMRLADGNAKKRGQRSARNGIITRHKWFKDYMVELGFVWTPTMTIGSGCTTHLKDGELPSGRLVCSLSRHYAAVIDGVINDTHDCSRNGTRCVYGYWTLSINNTNR